MKSIKFSPDVYEKFRVIRTKNPQLYKKILKQIRLFKENPRHKSLRLHKVTREVRNSWSISIDKSLRLIYTEQDFIYFFDLGTHDEVYRKR